jgi:hypothetical protein
MTEEREQYCYTRLWSPMIEEGEQDSHTRLCPQSLVTIAEFDYPDLLPQS